MNATRTLTYTESVEMITEQCCNCGILFAMTSYFVSERRKDEKWFYCPNGHSQHYAPSEATELKEKLRKREAELA